VLLQADVGQPDACRGLVADTLTQLQRLDILVHNAGIQRVGRLLDATDEDWSDVLNVNLSAAFHLARAAVPSMIERGGGGHIVNVASASAYHVHPGIASYVAAKHGLVGLTKALAVELARYGILVNAIAPGLTDTDMIAALDDEQRRRVLASVPLRRMASAEEIGAMVAWIVTGATYSTGNVFHASGGVVMG
jgi:NAD(P)-dependent dehydrogenase (short-subunit alcohol dehydrogenase family)